MNRNISRILATRFGLYRDRYMDELSALIERRVAATDLTSVSKTARTEEGADDDALMAILKASLKAAGVDDDVPLNSTGIPRPAVVEEPLHHKTA